MIGLSTGVTAVMDLVPPWNSEIFSVFPSPIAKQASFTSFTYRCIQCKSMFLTELFYMFHQEIPEVPPTPGDLDSEKQTGWRKYISIKKD